jgi:hypothetical protein
MEIFKDPISYIFRIIRHIIDKNNNYNSEYIIKAWGGCIGKKLRREEILEFNLVIANDILINELIDILKITEILRQNPKPIVNNQNNQNNHYSQNEKKNIQFLFNDKIINLNICSHLKYISGYNYNNYNLHIDPNIFFTCDNLCIDLNGNIATIIPSPIAEDSNINWITRSIYDALHKKFSIISTFEQTDLQKTIEINIKYTEMLNLGFTYVNDPSLPYKYNIFKTYTDITEFSSNAISTKCPICYENYDDPKDTVLLGCLHDYHINCLHTWTKKNKTCPLCRIDINFKPSTKFGNYDIDNIIQNYNVE